MSNLQIRILVFLYNDLYGSGEFIECTCSNIAWELKKHQLAIGKSMKSLYDKEMVYANYNDGENTTYWLSENGEKYLKYNNLV